MPQRRKEAQITINYLIYKNEKEKKKKTNVSFSLFALPFFVTLLIAVVPLWQYPLIVFCVYFYLNIISYHCANILACNTIFL